jgi:hypothetical protein
MKLLFLKKFIMLFTTTKLVITNNRQPGIFVAYIKDANGKKYIRTKWPNFKVGGKIPLADIPRTEVVAIRELPSRFRKFYMGLIGRKAKATYFRFAGGNPVPVTNKKKK